MQALDTLVLLPETNARECEEHGNRGYNGNRDTRLKIERGTMPKYHARPSLQYRYEHYDPFFNRGA